MLQAGSLPHFEYLLERSTSSLGSKRRLAAINVGFRWGPGHNRFIFAFGRYSIAESSLKLLLSSKNILEHKRLSSEMLNFPSAAELLSVSSNELQNQPLALIGILLNCCERIMDLRSQQYNLNMLSIGSTLESLYSPAMSEWVCGWGVKREEEPNRKSDLLFECYTDVAWAEKNCRELIDIGTQYLRLAQELGNNHDFEIPTTLVRSTVFRTQLHVYLLGYLEKSISTQFSYQYNHYMQKDTEATTAISKASHHIAAASQRDSATMTTIAYLTLAFLPATFVSAIFSTTVFNFQNWTTVTEDRGVVSPGWWVFVLCSVGATVATLVIWAAWHNRKKGSQIRPQGLRDDDQIGPLRV
jgi:hypothetical protein